MPDGMSRLEVDVEAARLAIEWKYLFATELQRVARHLAQESGSVTVEHYRQALEPAVARLLEAVHKRATESSHAERRQIA